MTNVEKPGDPGQESALPAVCFRCRSTYKVSEVEPGVLCCSGFCLKQHEAAKARAEAMKKDDDPTKADWQSGDYCSAIFTVDNAEYEAIIEDIKETEAGDRYADIRFLGYDDHQNVWLTDLMPSRGEAKRRGQLGMPSDPEAKEDSATETEPEVNGEVDKSEFGQAFKVGDFARAIYAVDGQEYEVRVDDINTGESQASVVFLGYGNCENVWLQDLKPSQGAKARNQQETVATGGNTTVEATEPPDAVDGGIENGKTLSDSTNSSADTVQRNWAIGDICGVSRDDKILKGTIMSVGMEDGHTYADVKFKSGEQGVFWANELLEWTEDINNNDKEAVETKEPANLENKETPVNQEAPVAPQHDEKELQDLKTQVKNYAQQNDDFAKSHAKLERELKKARDDIKGFKTMQEVYLQNMKKANAKNEEVETQLKKNDLELKKKNLELEEKDAKLKETESELKKARFNVTLMTDDNKKLISKVT